MTHRDPQTSPSGVGWQDEALRLREEGLTIRAIAEKVGKSRSVVGILFKPTYCECGNTRMRHALRCQACNAQAKRWRQDRIDELVAGMFDDGWPLKDIAAVLGRSVRTPRDAGSAIGPEMDRARARGLVTTTRVRTGYGRWAPA